MVLLIIRKVICLSFVSGYICITWPSFNKAITISTKSLWIVLCFHGVR